MIADVEGDYSDLSNVNISDSLPILTVRNIVLFPGVITPILIGRESSMKLVRMAEKNDTTLGGRLPDIETAIVDLIAVVAMNQADSL